jgi:hypothetical protein
MPFTDDQIKYAELYKETKELEVARLEKPADVIALLVWISSNQSVKPIIVGLPEGPDALPLILQALYEEDGQPSFVCFCSDARFTSIPCEDKDNIPEVHLEKGELAKRMEQGDPTVHEALIVVMANSDGEIHSVFYPYSYQNDILVWEEKDEEDLSSDLVSGRISDCLTSVFQQTTTSG